jgi:hypothetical protein
VKCEKRWPDRRVDMTITTYIYSCSLCKKCIKIRDRNERSACRNAEGIIEYKRNTKTGNTSKQKQQKSPGKRIVQCSYKRV